MRPIAWLRFQSELRPFPRSRCGIWGQEEKIMKTLLAKNLADADRVELTDDELENVAGAACYKSGRSITYDSGSGAGRMDDHYDCD